MGEKWAFRLAGKNDVPWVHACVAAAFEGYVERIGKPPGPMLRDFAEVIDKGKVWLALEGEREEFVANWLVEPAGHEERAGMIAMWGEQGYWFVDCVAVFPRWQGWGVGSALMELAEENARDKGFKEIRLYTNELMTKNLAWYGKLGFAELQRKEEAGYRRVYLAKRLVNA
jgi:ribosomal protein S18 acetylase RimI-like enzyme